MVGRNGLTRDVLVKIFADAGLDRPVSHLATGNISFGTAQVTTAFSERIEQGIAAVIGRTEPVFIRSIDQLRECVKDDPFRNPPFEDVHERCVSFTQGSTAGLELPLATARGDATAFAVQGSDIYSATRLVGGRPGTMGRVLERTLGNPVTTRNWNTIELIVRNQVPGA